MNKSKVLYFIVIFIFLFTIFMYTKTVKSNIDFTVEQDNGNIKWDSSAIKAKTNIRWQPKGYYLSLEPSNKDDFGYPLRRRTPMIKFYINNATVTAKERLKNNTLYSVENKLLGKYIKNQIIANKAFYSKLVEKYKKGDKKLYIDTFFETYEVIEDASTRKKIIDAFWRKNKKDFEKPNGKYIYLNGIKYEYDSRLDVVKRIRKNDLTDIDKIRGAEYWSEAAKKQWLNKNYYNHEIVYDIFSNVMVKYVDKNGVLLGDSSSIKINKINAKEVDVGKKRLSNPHYYFKQKEKGSKFIENDVQKHFGEEVTVTLPKEIIITKNNKKIKYKLISSEFREEATPSVSQNKKTGDKASEQKVVLGNENSMVVGIYEGPPPKITREEAEMSNELEDPEPSGVIGSGTLEDSPFDIEKGIPVSEYYYKNVITENYLLKYRFKNKKGEKFYDVKSYVNWRLSWTTGTGKKMKHHTAFSRVDYITTVKRKYSYWYIDNLEVYTLDGAVLYNNAISDTGIKMLPTGYIPPKVEYLTNLSEDEHVKPPPESLGTINLGVRSANGLIIPPYNPKSEIEATIGHLIVKNDRLIIDGKLIMDDSSVRKSAPKPKEPDAKGKKTDNKVLYEFGKKIENQIQNGIYDSSGQVFYTLSDSINSEGDNSLEFDIDYVNPVKVHTPVVCDYNIRDAKKWCQLIKPDKALYQLVLEKDFDIDILTTGNHLDIKGYGDRDYTKYTLKKEVIFPFDVMCGDRLCPANIPIVVTDNTNFRLPMTVTEGKYTIIVRTFAINYLSTSNSISETYANLAIDHYIAENKIKVEVSGRLIDFTLLNVKNTTMWEKENGSFILDGGVRLDSLPLIEGDNKKFKNEGSFKKGYAVNFAMTTIGNYYNELYGIRMDFDFFVLDEVTGNKIPVDIYYEEVSQKENKKLGLIKIGSRKDRENLHYIRVSEGDIGLYRYNKELLPRQMLYSGSNAYMQRWIGEYALPERIYVCKKGFNLEEYLKKHLSIYFDENFWIKSGWLVVTADISTLKGGIKTLSYINAENEREGYFNNWKYETMNRKKYMENGKEVRFAVGDLFVYDLSKKIWQERRAEIKKVY
nr:DUF5704 domain-containing protein [uncultured Catonella sp.]